MIKHGILQTFMRSGVIFAILMMLAPDLSVAIDACGGCGPGMVCIDCGRGPGCAVAPAVCCGNYTCGGGMICMNCGRGPECAVPPAVCCGNYTCGGGMICVQTSLGPQCAEPGADQGFGGTQGPAGGGQVGPRGGFPASPSALGSVWNETELGWQGTWTIRPGTNIFDAQWVHPNGRREAATLSINIKGRSVTIERHQPPKGSCRYTGTLSQDGRTVRGTYGCTWAKGPFNWSATIR